MGRVRVAVVSAGAVVALLVAVAVAGGANGHANYRAVCASPPAGYAHCHELVVTDAHGNPQASRSPSGLSPDTIKSVYGFSTSGTFGAGATIAIVDAYDDPTVESDLNTFSSQFRLPACTSSGSDPCFRKVDQNGGTSYPRADSGWSLEISLDVEWVHAIAPGAKILLVEAASNSFANLMAAEDEAAADAHYVSNSWGGSEFSGENSYDSHFSHSGVSFFVSAGDNGLPAEYPSASPNVISVGGTTLHFSGSTFSSETGWSSGGGGCSQYETATGAQAAFSQYAQVSCAGKRATPDVSLDADPSSGVSVYDSTRYSGQSGWFTVGGTSASSPMWAARSADSGVAVDSATVYGSTIPFRDITAGDNGASCLTGFDLCSGRGSWNDGSGGGGSATVPDPPTGLSAKPGDASVSLTWTAPTNDGGATLQGYDVYRSTNADMSGETKVATPVSETSYTDSGLTDGTTYYYEVTAVNSLGESSPSNQVSATPQASSQSAPSPPTSLTAVPAKGKGVQLSWSAPSDGSAISYNVYRSPDGITFTQVASTSSTSYKDTQTGRGGTFWYQVTSVGSAGSESVPSNTAGPVAAS